MTPWMAKLRMTRATTRWEGDLVIATFHGEGGEMVEIAGTAPQWAAMARGNDTPDQRRSARERFLAGEIDVAQFEREVIV